MAKKRISTWAHYALLIEALSLFAVSILATHYSSRYADIKASSPVDDIILSNTPVFNFEIVFVEMAIALCIFVVVLCFRYKKSSPFIIKSVSLFILIRAAFVSLTHIGPFPTRLTLDSHALDFITSGNDLFFSGHTGLPFLIALIFWRHHKYLRALFLSSSIVFGVIVLLSHLHYSIDVFAAFFITYAIYHISLKLFKRDYHHFVLEQAVIVKEKQPELEVLIKKTSKTLKKVK
jgi:hypothetical protein